MIHFSTENLTEKITSKPAIIPDTTKTSIHIKLNDVDIDDVNDNVNVNDELEADSGNITTDLDTDDETNFLVNNDTVQADPIPESSPRDEAINNSAESSRESSEDKSESTSSYIEAGTTASCNSSSSDADNNVTVRKLGGDIVETIDGVLLERARLNDSGTGSKENESPNVGHSSQGGSAKCSDYNRENNNQMIEALSPNIQVHKNALVENISAKYPTSPVSSGQSHAAVRPETPKRELGAKPEVKPRLTPPEPPPRKYFAKPAPLNFNASQQQSPSPVNSSPRDQQQQVGNDQKFCIDTYYL